MTDDRKPPSGIRRVASITQFRELRDGELRWIVNQETTQDEATGVMHTRATIRHPGVVVIVPFLDDGRVLLMRQYRYALDDELWEFPAGTLHGIEEPDGRVTSDETPEECAFRELEEETGWRAARLTHHGSVYAMPGMTDELIHIFSAHDLVQTSPDRDPGELIREVRGVTRVDIQGMLDRSELRDAKTIVALSLILK